MCVFYMINSIATRQAYTIQNMRTNHDDVVGHLSVAKPVMIGSMKTFLKLDGIFARINEKKVDKKKKVLLKDKGLTNVFVYCCQSL